MFIMSDYMLDHLDRNECSNVTLHNSLLYQVEVSDYVGVKSTKHFHGLTGMRMFVNSIRENWIIVTNTKMYPS